MPTSVKQVAEHFKLKIVSTIKWGTTFLNRHNGIYIVSLSSNISYLSTKSLNPQFDQEQTSLWLRNANEILMDGKEPSKHELLNRLRSFWLPDESILYIGKAEKQTLSERIYQFYNHKVGKKSPHKGGYWLKLLTLYKDTYLHLIETKSCGIMEENMLRYFKDRVSKDTREGLIDKDLTLPFANLQLRPGVIKKEWT